METETQNNLISKDNKLANKNIKEPEEQFHNEKYKKKSDFPNFLLKLYQILENDEYKDIIQWGENGQFFIVKNVHDFTEKILPKYYKHNNYSSFIRQLNMYDFHKKKSSQNKHIFHHQNFVKGQKDLMKKIKRKSKKEKENVPICDNQLTKLKQKNLLPFSNINNAYNNINKNINIIKSSLSNDDDGNLSNSIHSLFEFSKRPCLPMEIPSLNNIDINNDINFEKYDKKENVNSINNVNNEIVMDVLNNNDKKITKKNLENSLNYLTNSIAINTQMEKELEIKIEKLSKQNEEFIMQNQKMLEEIVSKNNYNKKLEAVICFILEMIMSKPKIKNNSELKNILLSNPQNNTKIEGNNYINNLSLVNSASPKLEINGIFSKNDFNQSGEVLEPFQNFLNKYLEKSKNSRPFEGNKINNYNSQQISNYNNIFYNMDNNTKNKNILKRNLICSGDDNNNEQTNYLISKKRKRSASFNSILNNLNNGKNNVYSFNNKNINLLTNEKFEKMEEKKIDNESINNEVVNSDNNENNESFLSWNKSKNIFDIDLSQEEENKSDISEWNKDLLNNSQSSINDVIKNCISDNDVFYDINN